MTNVLITGFGQKITDEITSELGIEGNNIILGNKNMIVEQHEENLPDVLLLNIEKEKFNTNIFEKITEFDHTACIFAVVDEKDSEINDTLYKFGVRVILQTPDHEDNKEIKQFIKELYNSCNDLEHEKCIGCWKTGRFDNLTQLN